MDRGRRGEAIRVIKRQLRELQTQPQPDASPAATERRTNRDLAATVSSWVEEFRRRRRESETASLLNLARLRA